MSDRRRKTVNAAVALLEALPEEWLSDVLARLGGRGVLAIPEQTVKPDRRCGICGLFYPHHMARQHIDEHPWEEPRRKGTT